MPGFNDEYHSLSRPGRITLQIAPDKPFVTAGGNFWPPKRVNYQLTQNQSRILGIEVALDISREVWYDVKHCGCYMESVLPRRAMSITGNDVASWMKHLQIDPGLACIADIRCEMIDENTGVLTVDHCYALDDMEKLGDPDIQKYNCHELEHKGLQQGVDYMNPKIKVRPLLLPQLGCKHEIACKWEFKLE
jgi:hypothetical protein